MRRREGWADGAINLEMLSVVGMGEMRARVEEEGTDLGGGEWGKSMVDLM